MKVDIHSCATLLSTAMGGAHMHSHYTPPPLSATKNRGTVWEARRGVQRAVSSGPKAGLVGGRVDVVLVSNSYERGEWVGIAAGGCSLSFNTHISM